MGLDITALQGIKRSRKEDAWFVYKNPYFPLQAERIRDGKYEAEKEFGFRAGSYGGYNEWRNQLAQLVGYESAEKAFKRQVGPMIELICFSDCEGVIGPKTCQKLYDDFVQWEEKAIATGDQWFIEKYKEWMKALKIGIKGCLLFH